ncbi:MAG: helix-turn-helix domain-containing protein, partial [Burkholderiales bacterium]|nr:helix-turn-helix domain-containing protein [Burkholderiales bacterium]
MDKQYRHFSVEDRAVIMIERCSGASVPSIARTLGRNASSISRELLRNHVASAKSNASCGYDATASSQAYGCRRLRCGRRRRMEEGTALFQHVYN